MSDSARDLLPPVLRSGRLAVDRRAAVSLAVVVVVAALLGGTYLWRARPHSAPLPPPSIAAPTAAATTATTGQPGVGVDPVATAPPSVVVVDVQGLVRRPGVVRLPTGSRVMDALKAAGGAAPGAGTASLNLARVLTDGEQLVVTKPGVAPPAQAAGSAPGQPGAGGDGGGSGATGTVVDLNSAGLDQLDSLPGVGPVLAQRILDWRAEHGRFTSVEELREVNGIGERRFADLKDRVRV